MNGIICAPRRKADPGKQITSNIRYVRRELDISFRDRYPFNDDFVTKNTIPRSIKKTSNSRVLMESSLIRKSLDHKEILKGGYNMRANKPKTKILIDGGDPDETLRIKKLLGFVDGQTTNPSLIAKNPEVQQLLASGHRLTTEEQKDEYKRIVQKISPLVGDAGVSIEVFADLDTTAEQMLAQGQEMFSWIPNAYIKYPCTHEGLRAAHVSVERGIRVNMTLCFSQEQAAGVYAATSGAKEPVYVSPFIGRLDDRGDNGMDVVRNILNMYQAGDHHVHVLAASIRHLDHLLYSFALNVELATVPGKVLESWAAQGSPLPDDGFVYQAIDSQGQALKPIEYKELDLNARWESFDLRHELTRKGIQKFVADYESTLRKSA